MKILLRFLAAGTLLVSSIVFAGFAGEAPVEIDRDLQQASGLPITARFSDNPDETIGCGVQYRVREEGGLSSFAFCQATLSFDPENRIICFTFNTELVDKIAELKHYSFVRFEWEEVGEEGEEFFECTAFRFTTQSHHIPEHLGLLPRLDDDEDDDD